MPQSRPPTPAGADPFTGLHFTGLHRLCGFNSLLVAGWAAGLLGASVMCVTGLSGQELTSLGPLPTSEQNPLHRLQLAPEAEGTDVVLPGSLRLSFRTAYSNIFEISESEQHEQLFDLEQMTSALAVRYGLADRWEIGGEVILHTGWGGIFDRVFSGFHQSLGLPNGGRETQPTGQHRVVLEGQGPDINFSLPARTFGLEGLSAFTKWQPVGEPGSPYGVSFRGTLRRASGPIEPGRIDGSFSMQLRASGQEEYDGIHLYGMAGVARLDPPTVVDALYSEWVGYFLFGSERRFDNGLAFLLQLSSGTPYVEAESYERSELNRFPMLLSLGLAGETDGGWTWQFGFSEDFPPESPSVDLTVVFDLARSIDLD